MHRLHFNSTINEKSQPLRQVRYRWGERIIKRRDLASRLLEVSTAIIAFSSIAYYLRAQIALYPEAFDQ